MAEDKDPAEVVETIRRSIEVSQRGSRRVRAHRFRELFGFRALSAQRRELVERLLAEAGIVVQPSLEEAGRDDWLVMSMPTLAVVREAHPDPRPSAEWFGYLQSVRPVTEREVELHFASPLFHGLGYRDEQEAAGFGILIVFTLLGVVVPLWDMATGPRDLAQVRWVLYPFIGSLALLIGYIVVYLIQLTRNKPDQQTASV
jgi:hypothetical protein